MKEFSNRGAVPSLRPFLLSRWLVLAAAAITAISAQAAAQMPHDDGWPPSFTAASPAPAQSFCQDGQAVAVYELLLTSLEPQPVAIEGIRVGDTEGKSRQKLGPLATAEKARVLPDFSRPEPEANLILAEGSSALIYMWVDLGDCPVPEVRLVHSIRISGQRRDGHTFSHDFEKIVPLRPSGPPMTVGPPVKGMWMLSNGLSNDSNHRTVVVSAGEWFISQRFGFDLVKIAEDGSDIAGQVTDNHAHLSYNQPVYAMTDGEVVTVQDSLAENVPTGKRGAPSTFQNAAGNYLILKAADDLYFLYAHLIPGSLAVQEGDRVRRGQAIARVGNSGNSTKPHLHVHAMTRGENPNLGHGRSFHFSEFELIIRQFNFSPEHRGRLTDGGERRTDELPPNRSIIRWR